MGVPGGMPLWAVVLPGLVCVAGCTETFQRLTQTDGRWAQRFYAKAETPEGVDFLVPAEEISQGQARQRLGYYEAIYDHRGQLQLLRRHVQTAYGPIVQMEIRYFCDSNGRLVREMSRRLDNQGRIHVRERLYDEDGRTALERELNPFGQPGAGGS